MAEKLGGSAYNIPNNGKVVDSDWTDDIDKQFATYGNEKEEREYISPDKVVTRNEQKRIDRIKSKKIGLTIGELAGIKFAA